MHPADFKSDPIGQSNNSTETWTTIKAWLDECDSHHLCVHSHAGSPESCWYPTRLIEIVSPAIFRVASSSTIHNKQHYVTLSHRWGQSEFLCLTSERKYEFEDGLSINSLSPTFQDAIWVARRLGIRHLWIDSLCIVQSGPDSKADWIRESATMSEVYSNAFCNISADWGSDKNGLFFDRHPQELETVALVAEFDADEIEELRDEGHEVQQLEQCHLVSFQDEIWRRQITDAPLNNRGWVVQERVLAPRVLHFTPREVFWECGQMKRSESYPVHLPQQLSSLLQEASFPLINGLGFQEAGNERTPENTRRAYDTWNHIWSFYDTCRLTKGSDKLIAIAGVARKMKTIVDDQYIAGIWLAALPGAMLWRSREDYYPKLARKPDQYRAPSFSWASTGNACIIDDRVDHPTATVSVACIKYRQQDRPPTDGDRFEGDIFGPMDVPMVELRVEGTLKSCFLIAKKSYAVFSELDILPKNDLETVSTMRYGGRVQMDNKELENNTKKMNSTFYYMLWNTGILRHDWVLLDLVDPILGRFQRIGLVSTIGVYLEQKQKTESLMFPQRNERHLPCWNYDPGTGRHTIYIV